MSISNNPAIEQLTANIQQWQSDNKKLKQKYKELVKTNKKLKEESLSKGFVDDISWLFIRLVCLLISGGIAYALLSLNIISPNIPFIVTTLCIFLLICIPIEKIKNLVFKVPNVETNVEIDDER